MSRCRRKITTLVYWVFISISCFLFGAADAKPSLSLDKAFLQLERQYNRKLHVYAIDSHSKKAISYHAGTPVPIQSTFKLMAAAFLLHQNKHPLTEKIQLKRSDLVLWSPISKRYLNKDVSLETLAEAAVRYSDNTAANLLIKQLGGLTALNQFARNIGNTSFSIRHYEPLLNSRSLSHDDTSTAKDMALSLYRLTLGNILPKAKRRLLLQWLESNTTSYKRIRLGVPLGFTVADKTGSGAYGVVNDVGLIWSPWCKPIVLSVYSHGENENDRWNELLIADATKLILDKFKQENNCFNYAAIN